MKRYALKPLFIFIAIIAFASAAFPSDSPLQVKNQFPLFLYLNSPYLETASYDDSFSISLSHSSIFMIKSSSDWSVKLDMELTELSLRYKKSVLNLFELGIEVPFLSLNSGFMDGFLESYHDTFGFADYGRSTRPKNEFLYEIKKDGVIIIKGENGRTSIGDIRISAKRMILGNDPVVSIKFDLEIPTGDASNGYGNGSLDAGASLLINKKITEKIKSYFNIGIVSPGDLKGYEKIELKEFYYGGIGIEAAYWKSLSIFGQVSVQTSPFPKTGISTVDRAAALLSIGGRYYLGKNSMEFSFTEDLNTAGAPDFTIAFLFKKGL